MSIFYAEKQSFIRIDIVVAVDNYIVHLWVTTPQTQLC